MLQLSLFGVPAEMLDDVLVESANRSEISDTHSEARDEQVTTLVPLSNRERFAGLPSRLVSAAKWCCPHSDCGAIHWYWPLRCCRCKRIVIFQPANEPAKLLSLRMESHEITTTSSTATHA